MPLYNDLEVRPRYGSALPSYEPEGVRLEAEPVDWGGVLGESALSGALETLPFAPPVAGLRGGAARWSPDPLGVGRSVSGRGAAFASDNPYVAATYAGAPSATIRMMPGDEAADVLGRWPITPGGKVYPFRVSPEDIVRIQNEPQHPPSQAAKWADSFRQSGRRSWPAGFSTQAESLMPGQAQAVRGVVDPGPRVAPALDQQGLYKVPSEQWAYREGVSPRRVGRPMLYEEVGSLADEAARRAGVDLSYVGGQVNKPYPLLEGLDPKLSAEDLKALSRHAAGVGFLGIDGYRLLDEDAEAIVREIQNDPRFSAARPGEGGVLFRGLAPMSDAPSIKQRLAGALKAGGKNILKGFTPLALAEAAAGGAVAGGVGGGLGYAAGGGSPESAGLFTPPGPGYEGVVSPELIERIAEQKEMEREAERQRLLEQYRASGYDIDPNTRLGDLR